MSTLVPTLNKRVQFFWFQKHSFWIGKTGISSSWTLFCAELEKVVSALPLLHCWAPPTSVCFLTNPHWEIFKSSWPAIKASVSTAAQFLIETSSCLQTSTKSCHLQFSQRVDSPSAASQLSTTYVQVFYLCRNSLSKINWVLVLLHHWAQLMCRFTKFPALPHLYTLTMLA